MDLASLALILSPLSASLQVSEDARPPAADRHGWRLALERINERIRSSPMAWLDGHLGVVFRLRMSPDGGRAMTWAEDGTLWLWNAWTGEPTALLGMFGMGQDRPSKGGAWNERWPNFAFGPGGERILVVEPLAGAAGLWDGRSGEFLGTLGDQADEAHAAVFAPDGRRIAVAMETRVQFFDAATASSLDTPRIEADGVKELAFGPDGSLILALQGSGRASLWDAGSGALLGELGSPDLPLFRVTFSADGTRVLGTSKDGAALVWPTRPPPGTPLQPTVASAPDEDAAFVDWGTGRWLGSPMELPDQGTAVLPRGDRLLVVTREGALVLWEPREGRSVAKLEGVRWSLFAPFWAGFSPDGERLLTLQSTSGQIWNTSTGEKLADLEGGAIPFTGDHARFSADSRYFATAAVATPSGQPAARIFDGRTGRLVAEHPMGSGSVVSMDFSATGRLGATSAEGWAAVLDGSGAPCVLAGHALAVAEPYLHESLARFDSTSGRVHSSASKRSVGTACFERPWDVRTGAPWTALPLEAPRAGGVLAGGDVLSFELRSPVVGSVVADSPAEQAGIQAGDRILRIGGRAVETAEALGAAMDAAPSRTSVVVMRAGQEHELPIELPWVANGGRRLLGVKWAPGAVAVLRDPGDGAIRRSVLLEGEALERVLQVAADRDGSRLLLLLWGRAVLYDLASGSRLATLKLNTPTGVSSYDFRQHLAVLSPDGDVVAAAGSSEVRLWRAGSDGDPEELRGGVIDLVFSPDGRRLAGASKDGSVIVWDIDGHERVHELTGHDGPVRFVAFDSGGKRVVSVGDDDPSPRVWDLTADKGPLVLEGHAGTLGRASFSPDGACVLTLGDDGTARLWDAESGAAVAVLEGHLAPVRHGEFSPDGRRILTLGMDASTRIWEGADGRLLATRVDYDDGWVVFAPSGHFVAGGEGAEHAGIVVNGRRYPLSSYAEVYRSPEKVAASLAGRDVRPPSFVPQAPDVRVASPLDSLVQERRFRLEVLIEDAYGIESVSVVQDGRPLDAEWLGEHLAQSGRTARLSADIELPEGRNETTLQIRATNARHVKSARRTVFVRHEPPQRELYFLGMGVADYEDDRLDLAYPTKDVDDLIARLSAEQGGYYAKVNVLRLANEEVTPGKMRKAREEFLLQAEPEDTIIVFAAGHGVRSESGEYYFLTHGTSPDDPYDGIERAVLESLVTWNKLHAKRRILLLDTCHSGEAFGQGKRGIAVDSFEQTEVDKAAGTGLYILAASSERGFAQETQGNGLFTRALLEGLDGGADRNGDGLVGIDELRAYVTTAVHERSGGRQRPTAPRIEGGEDFPLTKKR